jgi:hypothetical protein
MDLKKKIGKFWAYSKSDLMISGPRKIRSGESYYFDKNPLFYGSPFLWAFKFGKLFCLFRIRKTFRDFL